MTESYASSGSMTKTRAGVIAAQLNYVVRETTGSTSVKQVLEKGIVDNQWISTVSVQAYDNEERLWAEIEASIDWDRHKVNLRRHGENVEIDSNLPVGIQVNRMIGEMVEWFKTYAEVAELNTCWTISYLDDITNDDAKRDKINEELGLTRLKSRKYVKKLENIDIVLDKIPEIVDELHLVLKVADV